MNIQLQTQIKPRTVSNAFFDLSPSGLLQCASLPSWERSRGQEGFLHEALRSPGQRHLLQASVETELARLLTEGGVSPNLAAGGALPQVSANGIQLTSDTNTNPYEPGQQIAQAVYGV